VREKHCWLVETVRIIRQANMTNVFVIRTSLNLVEESDLLTLVLGEAERSDAATFLMMPFFIF
jgi:hypothetical protein